MGSKTFRLFFYCQDTCNVNILTPLGTVTCCIMTFAYNYAAEWVNVYELL